MRVITKLHAVGNNYQELLVNAENKWQEYTGDNLAKLPTDSEIDVISNDFTNDKTVVEKHFKYTGTVTIRTKVN